MRKLYVKRKWSIIECASRIYLYVQCPAEYATHKFGDKSFAEYALKNGKTVAVDILDEQTEVIIESSTMQATYTVPAGSGDVSLIASPKFSPANGNPFTIKENV